MKNFFETVSQETFPDTAFSRLFASKRTLFETISLFPLVEREKWFQASVERKTPVVAFAFTGRIANIRFSRRGRPVIALPGVLAPLALTPAMIAARQAHYRNEAELCADTHGAIAGAERRAIQ